MKKNRKNKKNNSKLMPDLTVDKNISHIKNSLFVFLFCMIIFYLVIFIEASEKITRDMPELRPVKYPLVREMKMRKIIGDHPLAEMIPYISKQDKKTASFLVAIAKKESNWGKYSPKKGKKECYNYWGFRGSYNQTASGYSCFDSEKQAVEVVGERIEKLIENGADTPEKMIVWKCGKSCSGHSVQSVQKWINDVDFYYKKVNERG